MQMYIHIYIYICIIICLHMYIAVHTHAYNDVYTQSVYIYMQQPQFIIYPTTSTESVFCNSCYVFCAMYCVLCSLI